MWQKFLDWLKEIFSQPQHPSQPTPIGSDFMRVFCGVAEHFASLDIREEWGFNRGSWVDKFTASVNGEKGEAWCLNFVQAQTKTSIIREIVFDLFPHEAANYLAKIQEIDGKIPDHRHCMTLYRWALNKGLIFDTPHAGDIAIWNYSGTDSGHAAIVLSRIDDTRFRSVEGNTSSGSAVEREGDGVYIKVRYFNPKRQGKMVLMGFIRTARIFGG